MPLEDQDGVQVSSHWEKKAVGNEFMIAASKKGSYISGVSLALLETTGWYDVDYSLSEKTTWGKNKKCGFLDTQNCEFDEFCSFEGIGCDWERTAYGFCQIDRFAGSCKIVKYFSNTICFD